LRKSSFPSALFVASVASVPVESEFEAPRVFELAALPESEEEDTATCL
jgi:hypothetical protein